ncbi:hypothetical protein Lsan_0764 [Legionella santicrucis]|uniref:Uncharacterized protein n=1 Tax=Legionella santicrucis TaxID=45074 RepID=A0A0W0Z975_9GAMM|nr:hypothetical protein Lsan_0764 [Legionella santicrucis]
MIPFYPGHIMTEFYGLCKKNQQITVVFFFTGRVLDSIQEQSIFKTYDAFVTTLILILVALILHFIKMRG